MEQTTINSLLISQALLNNESAHFLTLVLTQDWICMWNGLQSLQQNQNCD